MRKSTCLRIDKHKCHLWLNYSSETFTILIFIVKSFCLLWSCLSSHLLAINLFVYLSVFRSSEGGSRNQLRLLENLRFLSEQTILGLLFFLFFFLFLYWLFIIITATCVAVLIDPASPSLRRWVREFLNEENQGLDVLVEYLSFAQYAVTQVTFF